MRIPRVFVSRTIREGEQIELPAEEARHLLAVLRRREGDRLWVSSPGGVFHGTLDRVVRDDAGQRALVTVGGPGEGVEIPVTPWTVAVAMVKGPGLELAVRFGSELGLERVIPLVTERTVVRQMGLSKLERLRRIAREAAKQCGRSVPLEVSSPGTFSDLVSEASPPGCWISTPGARWPGMAAFSGAGEAEGVDSGLFLVGPEGGFTPAELEEAIAQGFRPLGFPTPVLRTPTAVILLAALSLVLKDGTEPSAG